MRREVFCCILAVALGWSFCAAADTPDSIYSELAKRQYNEPPVVAAEKAFDLSRKDVSDLMLKKSNAPSEREAGENAPNAVLSAMLKSDPAKAIEWILARYQELTPYGRLIVVSALEGTQDKEGYAILAHLLQDQEPVPDPGASARRATFYYRDMRVCDYAYDSLAIKVWEMAGKPKVPRSDLRTSTPLEERDQTIREFRERWATDSETILKDVPSLAADHPSLKLKLEDLMKTPPQAACSRPDGDASESDADSILSGFSCTAANGTDTTAETIGGHCALEASLGGE